MNSVKNWFNNLKFWQKGLIIGFLIDIMRYFLMFFIFPHCLGGISFTPRCTLPSVLNIFDYPLLIFPFVNIVPFTVYGSIVGLISDVIRKRKQEGVPNKVLIKQTKQGILLIILGFLSSLVILEFSLQLVGLHMNIITEIITVLIMYFNPIFL